MHYQIKANENLTKPDTEEFHQREKLEVQWYDEAKKIRKELLRQSQRRAQLHMNRISSKKPFYQIPKIADLPELGGIEGKKILDVMDEVTDLLNAQKEQIEKYRRKVVDILMLPLVDEDEGKETTGDEYEDSTKVQDELYVYQLALRAAVADRQATANGMPDGLIEHELQEAEKQALRKQGHAPELVLEVVNARRKLLPSTETGSLKGVISSTRSLLNALEWRADSGDGRAAAEVDILQKQLAKIQSIANDHGKGLVELVKEQELFRAAMNQRLEFYRQLQHVSDTVAPYKEELDEVFNERAFNARERGREQRKRAVAGHKNKHNYLVNLRHENAQMDVKHECIICQDVFEIGVLTSCGHKVSSSTNHGKLHGTNHRVVLQRVHQPLVACPPYLSTLQGQAVFVGLHRHHFEAKYHESTRRGARRRKCIATLHS
jgi:E3 ubiquitin-protein ligase SHPRH